jgi:hypothetical protein
MSISSVSASQATLVPPGSQPLTEIKNDFQQLGQALQSGNLSSAQQAYATLSQLVSQNPPPGGASGQKNPLSLALSQIGGALQSGNLAGAQQAFSALQSAAQAHGGQGGGAVGGAGGHGGGGGSGGGGSSSASSTTIVSETSTTSASGVTTTVITYANGTKATTTTYGPTPTSAKGVIA